MITVIALIKMTIKIMNVNVVQETVLDILYPQMNGQNILNM